MKNKRGYERSEEYEVKGSCKVNDRMENSIRAKTLPSVAATLSINIRPPLPHGFTSSPLYFPRIPELPPFYIDGRQPKCFFEELPKDTLVVGTSPTN